MRGEREKDMVRRGCSQKTRGNPEKLLDFGGQR